MGTRFGQYGWENMSHLYWWRAPLTFAKMAKKPTNAGF
jgi:hypothetical protein